MTSDDFAEFVDQQLADAELVAVQDDFTSKLVTAYVRSSMVLGWAQEGERVDPELWPQLREWLDDSIRELEQLRG